MTLCRGGCLIPSAATLPCGGDVTVGGIFPLAVAMPWTVALLLAVIDISVGGDVPLVATLDRWR